VRNDRPPPQACPQGAEAGADAEDRPTAQAAGTAYFGDAIPTLAFCCAVLGAPTGKRLAPVMAELVPRLRRFEDLDVTDEVASALIAMSPATMDLRLAEALPDRDDGTGVPQQVDVGRTDATTRCVLDRLTTSRPPLRSQTAEAGSPRLRRR